MNSLNAARDPQLYLQEIIKHTKRIEKTINGVDYTTFSSDQDKIDILDANMEKIGEAIRVLDKYPKVRAQFYYYHVPVRKLVNIRKILIHEYFSLDIESMWQTANELIALRQKFEKILFALQNF
jgi:uncharacterized protein with HEPN domain